MLHAHVLLDNAAGDARALLLTIDAADGDGPARWHPLADLGTRTRHNARFSRHLVADGLAEVKRVADGFRARLTARGRKVAKSLVRPALYMD